MWVAMVVMMLLVLLVFLLATRTIGLLLTLEHLDRYRYGKPVC